MIEHHKNLKDFNTFMVPAEARYFARVSHINALKKIMASPEWLRSKKHLVLGGGSNILFVDDYDGFVLKNEIQGKEIIKENDDEILLRVGAGELWHDFVMWSVEQGLWGIENLAYIPGTVGAAPVQNIGAYGVEVSSSIDSVTCIDRESLEEKIFSAQDCDFSYRGSFFKKNAGKYIITAVSFKLQKKGNPILNYGRVAESLSEKGIKNPTSKNIAEVIMEIRKSKLPEVGEIGMAGSFFKNPIVSKKDFEIIQKKFPQIKYFKLENGMVKIPAGWILDELGYRGFQSGHVGNYEKHALIVIHDGNGSGTEVYQHIQNIIKKVKNVFNIDLEPEVQII